LAFHLKAMKKKLLIIEDDLDLRSIYKNLFDREGYEVQFSIDGISILNNRFVTPDVILLDRWLGLVDGLEVCRHLKANEVTKLIPIILVSGSASIRKAAEEAGAEAALSKPVELKELLQVVHYWATIHDSKTPFPNSRL
jgi:CheY-like chemotaxis protein